MRLPCKPSFQQCPRAPARPEYSTWRWSRRRCTTRSRRFEQTFRAVCRAIPNASGSPVAAAAVAAHDVLAARFPGAGSEPRHAPQTYLSDRGLLGDAGIVVGHQAAAGHYQPAGGRRKLPARTRRSSLGARGQANGVRRSRPSRRWRALVGHVIPFTLKDAAQLRASPPPPHLSSGRYAQDYNEVKALGSIKSTAPHAGADRPRPLLRR